MGEGFTIDSTADRSLLQEVVPFVLKLTIRCVAALENVSLPPLYDSGLDETQFRLSDEPAGGVIEHDAKYFSVRLRVLNRSVREIPPIEFSWFNPHRGIYETTYSKPIALSVGEAQLVSAQHVERATHIAEPKEEAVHHDTHDDLGMGTGVDLSDAELAIETDLSVLLAPSDRGWRRESVQIAAYVLGFVALAIALGLRRRKSLDPELLVRQRKLSEQRQHIEKAVSVREVVDCVRRMGAIATTLPRSEYDQFLRECDVLVYAPNAGVGDDLDGTLRRRALLLAEQMIERSR